MFGRGLPIANNVKSFVSVCWLQALSAVPQLADAPCADANSAIADVMSGVGRSLRIALASWCGGGSTLSTASARRIEGTGLLPALAKAFTTWAAALHPNSPQQQQMAQLPPREQQQQFNQLAYPLGQPVLLWQHLLMYWPGDVLGKRVALTETLEPAAALEALHEQRKGKSPVQAQQQQQQQQQQRKAKIAVAPHHELALMPALGLALPCGIELPEVLRADQHILESVPYMEPPGGPNSSTTTSSSSSSVSSSKLDIDALVLPLVELLAPAASAQDVKLMAAADPAALRAMQDTPAVVADKRGQVIQGLFARGSVEVLAQAFLQAPAAVSAALEVAHRSDPLLQFLSMSPHMLFCIDMIKCCM
ncbi:hypothetical protein OEZ85_002162 [Tetradesmus obliquus]|uniref:Uncharacterized protein n=1 Tax=Tetradesmus obliquus TaxID=3088 RepID=A0ABY8U783_TETOB|nr:hypothetical protein OEZ85_002162 [Tetradesmus obliquus]